MPGQRRLLYFLPCPDLPEYPWPSLPACDHFDGLSLPLHWNFLRTPEDDFWSLSERTGYLRVRLRPVQLSDSGNPSFIGRRQQHIHFAASVALEFNPQNSQECSGLALIQNNNFHFTFVITLDTQPVVRLTKRADGKEEILAEKPVEAGRLYLKVEAQKQSYNFYAATRPGDWEVIAEGIDGRILSTPVTGGFVGAYIAMYASSNGQPGSNYADFDWFDYAGLD
jgi:xylan 1,4-beta-xylosidase